VEDGHRTGMRENGNAHRINISTRIHYAERVTEEVEVRPEEERPTENV